MPSDLSIFAARLRDFVNICADEPEFGSPVLDPALQSHCDAEFNGMALVLCALQFTHNPAYRKFCEARGTPPETVNHWRQIPAVPAAAFKELELTSLTATARTAVFHSSGTTGQRPSQHFHSDESLVLYEESLWHWFRVHLLPLPETSQLSFLAPSPGKAPHSSLVYMFEVIRQQLKSPPFACLATVTEDGAWDLDYDSIVRALESGADQNRPQILLGTAFSFVHLLDHLAERKLRFELPARSRVMETGGYKGRSRSVPRTELHALITERLGIPPTHIVCEYGMSELSSQAYDLAIQNSKFKIQNCGRVFRFPPWARALVVSPETGLEVADGETGLLRIFDLANVFSVMAIQTEDLAVRCGNGFELLGRAPVSEPRGCSLMPRSTLTERQS